MKHIRMGRRRAPTERPWPGGTLAGSVRPGHRPGQYARADRTFRKGGREVITWVGRCPWPAVRTLTRAAAIAHHEQVHMWECVLLTSGAAPLTAAGPLRWVPSLAGHRLAGSYLPAKNPSETG